MSLHAARATRLARVVLLLLCSGALVAGGAFSARRPARAAGATAPEKLWAYVGTYTGKSKGIYRCELDLRSGELTLQGLAATTPNPSFLALDPTHRFLYAVNEGNATVSAFAIDPGTGMLTLLNRQPSRGTSPAHLIVDPSGKNVLVANYGSGSVAVLPIGPDGRLQPASAFVQHHGSRVNRGGPHAHCVTLDPANRRAYVADLGLDQVLIYQFDPAQGLLAANMPPFAAVTPGSGPRHFVFHPNGRTAYVINEIASTVTTFAFDPATGALQPQQTLSTLPADFKKTNTTAEIQVHPSGKFLYGSNRGRDSIALFAVDPATGLLTAAGDTPTGGKTPRNFAIDPTGAYLLAANQDSGTVVVFRIDPETGALTPTGHMVAISMPVCVVMMPPPG